MAAWLLPALVTAPAVFAVGETYQIMAPVDRDLVMGVEIAGKRYYDHSNGILRSDTRIHRVTVPMAELDRAGWYTVFYREIIERVPYWSRSSDEYAVTVPFRPLPAEGDLRIMHISDTHGNFDLSSAAGSLFGNRLDLLILNGDLPDHTGSVENLLLIYRLADALTHGQKPVIFSRGNHDTRGKGAEHLAEYTPTDNGKSYFTVRLGRLWCIVLDGAEDKPDEHTVYGHLNVCHEFRLEETDFVRSVCRAGGYAADGVEYRLIVAHSPLSYIQEPPFDIERDIYDEWLTLLKEHVKPQLFLAGHLHTIEISRDGGRLDNCAVGQVCPVVIGSLPKKDNFYACGVTLRGNAADVVFPDKDGVPAGSDTVSL